MYVHQILYLLTILNHIYSLPQFNRVFQGTLFVSIWALVVIGGKKWRILVGVKIYKKCRGGKIWFLYGGKNQKKLYIGRKNYMVGKYWLFCCMKGPIVIFTAYVNWGCVCMGGTNLQKVGGLEVLYRGHEKNCRRWKIAKIVASTQ